MGAVGVAAPGGGNGADWGVGGVKFGAGGGAMLVCAGVCMGAVGGGGMVYMEAVIGFLLGRSRHFLSPFSFLTVWALMYS